MSLALNVRDTSIPGNWWYSGSKKKYANLDVGVDPEDMTSFIALKSGAPYSFTRSLLSELVDCVKELDRQYGPVVKNRVFLSKRPGVFSLGGDLAFLRQCILEVNQQALSDYGLTALNAIWESVTGSGRDDLISMALVQGEAQGGGFEAALASHVLIAERGTWFGFPEGLFGLFPGMGAKALLSARVSVEKANNIIGSARRHSAEELYSAGVVDFLAEPGHGLQLVNHLCADTCRSRLLELRSRFLNVDKAELNTTVLEWVDLAMHLSQKHIRTIDFLIQAQIKTCGVMPSIRVI